MTGHIPSRLIYCITSPSSRRPTAARLMAALGSPDRGICFMYLAEPSHIEKNLKPYHWYQELVFLGATYLNFPETYVRSIEAIESMDDQDEARRTRHDQLIEEILNFSPCGSEPSYD